MSNDNWKNKSVAERQRDNWIAMFGAPIHAPIGCTAPSRAKSMGGKWCDGAFADTRVEVGESFTVNEVHHLGPDGTVIIGGEVQS